MCYTMLPPLATQPFSVVDPTIGQVRQLRGAQIFIGSACKTSSTLFGTTPNASPFYVLWPWSPLLPIPPPFQHSIPYLFLLSLCIFWSFISLFCDWYRCPKISQPWIQCPLLLTWWYVSVCVPCPISADHYIGQTRNTFKGTNPTQQQIYNRHSFRLFLRGLLPHLQLIDNN